MKNTATYSCVAALSLGTAFAGPQDVVTPPAEPDAFQWLTPSLHVNARYEFRDVDGFDPSHALTVRERAGLKFGSFGGFTAFVEGEFTQDIVDDYKAFPGVGGAARANLRPATPGNSVIADPANAELNRAWLQYKNDAFSIKVGRQRLKFNGDAIIGNVGWRQNEQTFDAIRFTTKAIDNLTFDYVYSDRVKRIFGADARGGLRDWEGDFHFINAAYTGVEGVDLTAYAMLTEFDPGRGPASANGDTYGLIASGKAGDFSLYGEVAYQTADTTGFEDAFYSHVKASTKIGSHTVGLGWEYLGEDFYTPFATVHKFNGFADTNILNRLGLAGGHDGINNPYFFHATKLPGGVVWKNWVHLIDAENGAGADLSGWEYDMVLAKKFGNGFNALFKFYHFEADSGSVARTTTGAVLDFGYKF